MNEMIKALINYTRLGPWVLLCLVSVDCFAKTMIVTHRSPDIAKDDRSSYEIALIKLALEKSTEDLDSFYLQPAPVMSAKRGLRSLQNNAFSNLVLSFPHTEVLVATTANEIDFVRFPIELGFLGVRTCFVSDNAKEKFAKVSNIEDLKAFTYGQGRNWGDVSILRHNDLNVLEVDSYENLFRMLSLNRFDVFCRGTNEVLSEYNTYKDGYNLNYDRTIALRYVFPRFLYYNKKNKELGRRLTLGLQKAYQDGSLKKLWTQMKSKNMDFVELSKRKIFDLENPKVKEIKFNYEQYFADWVLMKK